MKSTKKVEIPKTGFAGFISHFKDDIISGLSVSLIALPLCMGIAMASNVPVMAGFAAAIVGGIIASRFGGTFVTISGPAAGLIVVTLGAIESLGAGDPSAGYRYALAAIVIGGIIMALFGVLKLGKLGDFFPSSAVHGMLAAIGIIIMVKQLYVAIGATAHSGEIMDMIINIPDGFAHLNYQVFYVGLISIIILIVHPMINNKFIKAVPAPMWAILLTLPWDQLYGVYHGKEVILNNEMHLEGGGIHALFHLPNQIFGEGALQFPDFSKIGLPIFWLAVLSFALVSAIESLLSAKAVDSLDPFKRKSNLDKDLFAMGGGSALAGAVGGLPIISEIVRSSANINNGAKTPWANFWHGVFLLIFVLFGMEIIHLVPVSALAAMLVFTGFKLASPSEFKHVYQIGKLELLVFVVTLVTVLLTDLIIGIAAGIIVNLIIHVLYKTSIKNLFKLKFNEIIKTQDDVTLELSESLIFSNYLTLAKLIKKHQACKELILDFSNVTKIDHTVMHHIEGWKRAFSEEGRKLQYANMNHLNPISKHSLSERRIGDSSANYILNRSDFFEKLSKKNNWVLDKEFNQNITLWNEFNSLDNGVVRQVSHSVEWHENESSFVIADLVIIEQTGFDNLLNKLVLKININDYTFPHFKLLDDKNSNNFFDTLNSKNIKVFEFPELAEKYTLTGEVKLKVRSFFSNPKLIDFLKKSPEFSMETKESGRGIIIYSKNPILEEQEVNELIDFANQLVPILLEERESMLLEI